MAVNAVGIDQNIDGGMGIASPHETVSERDIAQNGFAMDRTVVCRTVVCRTRTNADGFLHDLRLHSGIRDAG